MAPPPPRVTQRVAPEALDGLARRPSRAAIAVIVAGRVHPLPVAMRRSEGHLLVGIAREALPAEGLPDRAVLVVDDGRYWFELRALVWRGRVAAAGLPPDRTPEDLAWYEIVSDSAVAWDYGVLREEG